MGSVNGDHPYKRWADRRRSCGLGFKNRPRLLLAAHIWRLRPENSVDHHTASHPPGAVCDLGLVGLLARMSANLLSMGSVESGRSVRR